MSKFLSCVLLLVAWSCDAASFADPAGDIATLVDRVIERSALMHDVAAWKWHHQRPIADAAREDALRVQVRSKARQLGLEPDPVVAFFDVQMSWARELQHRAFDSLANAPPAATRLRDLATDLRPVLDRIGDEMLLQLYVLAPYLQDTTFQASMQTLVTHCAGAELTSAEANQLVSALRSIRRIETNVRERVKASGVLRVGLTGDYAPFSLERGGEISGADVDLANDFAATLGVNVRFVRTTWSRLMTDHQAGYFDVAAGGISITPDRAAKARFTPAYHVGGKTPVVRCGEERRYDTVDEINAAGVRVVVNRGGTNETFARDRLAKAQLRVVEDNRTVFDEIAEGRADVMVTDDIEADLQARTGNGLCRATSATFTRAEKAWLLPVDEQWQQTVSAWMWAAIREGKVTRALQHAR